MKIPLDSVQTGDWLICTRGPKQAKFTPWGEKVEIVRHEIEGVLFRVEAMSGPMLFMTVYPVPCGATDHSHAPWSGVFNFLDCEWQKAAPSYVRTYLRKLRVHPKPTRRRLTGIVTEEEMNQIARDLFGSNKPNVRPDFDDDDGENDTRFK